jgi:hypothetical protein
MPNIARWGNGDPPFGNTTVQVIIFLGCFLGRLLLFFQMYAFAAISFYDFKRRLKAFTLLGRITQYPGVLLTEILTDVHYKGDKKDRKLSRHKINPDETEEEGGEDIEIEDIANGERHLKITSPLLKNKRLYVDLAEGQNAFAWILMRRTLKAFGTSYFNRIQAYVGILFLWALGALAMLNTMLWSKMDHHYTSPLYICMQVFFISVNVLAAITEATKLRECPKPLAMVIIRTSTLTQSPALSFLLSTRFRSPPRTSSQTD